MKRTISATLELHTIERLNQEQNKSRIIEKALEAYFAENEPYTPDPDCILIPIQKYAELDGVQRQAVLKKVATGELERYDDFIVLDKTHRFNCFQSMWDLKQKVEALEDKIGMLVI